MISEEYTFRIWCISAFFLNRILDSPFAFLIRATDFLYPQEFIQQKNVYGIGKTNLSVK